MSTKTVELSSSSTLSSALDLVDRIEKLKGNGILDLVKGKNDKKIKYYYLTNAGVDFFRVITDFSLWTKKRLEKDTHPLSVDAFEETDLKSINT